jgi:hypothetical protein
MFITRPEQFTTFKIVEASYKSFNIGYTFLNLVKAAS